MELKEIKWQQNTSHKIGLIHFVTVSYTRGAKRSFLLQIAETIFLLNRSGFNDFSLITIFFLNENEEKINNNDEYIRGVLLIQSPLNQHEDASNNVCFGATTIISILYKHIHESVAESLGERERAAELDITHRCVDTIACRLYTYTSIYYFNGSF